MKPRFRKLSLLIGCIATLSAISACVTNRHEALYSAADRLDRSSAHFVSQIRYQGDDSRRDRLSRDAEALARYARKFDVDVRQSESRSLLADDYHQVEDGYEELHRQLADEGYAAQDHLVLEDFDRVTSAYHDVQAAMVTYAADSERR